LFVSKKKEMATEQQPSPQFTITQAECTQLNVLKTQVQCMQESRAVIAKRVAEESKVLLNDITDRMIDYRGDSEAEIESGKDFVKQIRILMNELDIPSDPASQLHKSASQLQKFLTEIGWV
jgi:hypothetical protein